MVSSGGGVIVNTASVAGMLGPRNMWWTTVEGQARCKLLAATDICIRRIGILNQWPSVPVCVCVLTHDSSFQAQGTSM